MGSTAADAPLSSREAAESKERRERLPVMVGEEKTGLMAENDEKRIEGGRGRGRTKVESRKSKVRKRPSECWK
jgi:hypothetical protein